jgi:pyruvate,water dikinase
LARLTAAGLPVPGGFQITINAYRRFVSENSLTEEAAAGARAGDLATLDHASSQIQSLIEGGTIPEDIAALIRQSYAELGPNDVPVAVRSSATAEDLPGLSFAGQYETFLNLHGIENVLAAVKRCWASLWTARALDYRARPGIRPEEVSLAVVVQHFIPADVVGILFTANPVTGARNQMMINAGWRLGEAIVGGHATPDTIVVNKQTGLIESQEITVKHQRRPERRHPLPH